MRFTELINKYFEQLTKQDLQLANYISQNMTEVVGMKSEELAERAYVSKGSIFQFIKRLELNSFYELKLSIKNDMQTESNREDTYSQVIQKYYGFISQALRHNSVKEIADRFVDSRLIYIYGTGNEQKLQANIMKDILQCLGITAIIVFDKGEFDYAKRTFNESDMLVLISYKGENDEAVSMIKESKALGIQTVAITKNSINTMSKLADDYLLIPTESIKTPTQLTYEINTTFYLVLDQLFLEIYKLVGDGYES